ncbi:MAG: MBL fold metallo-hydrolase [Aeromicrobium sp.]
MRFTYSYLVAADSGDFLIIDPGMRSARGAEQLERGIAQAGLDLARLRGVVVTHFHPDHLGAAQELATRTGAWLGMHPREAAFFDPGEHSDLFARDRSWLMGCGIPREVQDRLVMTPLTFADAFSGANPDRLLDDGAMLELEGRNLEVLWTPGHTAGHICIIDHDERLVFSGDHILPRITPNVGVDTHDPDRDAIAQYYDSLEQVSSWPDYEICPAHEYRFRGIDTRADELRRHQEARSAEVAALLASDPDTSVWDVARRLTWSRGWESLDGQNLRSALAETSSHINHLRTPEADRWRRMDDPHNRLTA